MTFEEILDQVLDMLQRRGRVSYRALKRQFNLDDDYLEDIKEELSYVRHPVRDEDGRGLLWIGDPGATPTSVTGPNDASPVSAEPLASRPHTSPDAERRQLTVMFCDLADSTQLAGQLDAEDLRQVVRAYQATGAAVIRRYDGHIAQYLGDALLVYFGHPHAHEDDAQRAVRASLGILEAMRDLNAGLERDKGVRLAVRIGIHTGMVVVGEMGSGDRLEQLAMGEAPNVAARLQGLAERDTVLISADTHRLVQGYFSVDDLGTPALKGVAEAMQVYRVVGESPVQSRLEVVGTRGLTPLVGRDEEVGLLRRRWTQSSEGVGQMVLIQGEAGIGKSRLAETIRDHVMRQSSPRLAFRCSPYHQNSALYPVITHVQQVLQFEQHDPPDVKLAKLTHGLQTYRLPQVEVVPLLARFLSIPLPDNSSPALTLTPQQQKQQTLDILVAWLLEEAERQPVLAVWEDLHWADPTTLEYLGLVIEQAPTVPMLHVLTYRPEFSPPWPLRSHMTPLTLSRLERPQVEAMITQLARGKALPPDVVQHIVAKTDGVPLYVEELTKMLLESDLLREEAARYVLTGPLSDVTIPATLHDALMARLDRAQHAKEVAQFAAVIGREFGYDLLQAITPHDAATLQASLAQLVDAELLYQRGRPPHARYRFKHALIQDAAYASLLRSTRQQVHRRIAQVLEETFPDTVETQPEVLAHHYTESGMYEPAVAYWQRAGQRAIARSANVEAMRHLTRGLEVLALLPETIQRTHQELDLQIALGRAVMAAQGFSAPESERVHLRARDLCQQLGDTTRLFSALYGLWRYYVTACKLDLARETGEQLLSLAQHLNAPVLLVGSHAALAVTCTFLGELARARSHAEHGMRLYDQHACDPSQFPYEPDPKITCLMYLAQGLVLLGYPDQAGQRITQCLALTQVHNRPFGRAYALSYAASCYQMRREAQRVQELAEEAIALAQEHGFAQWLGHSQVRRGWGYAMQGRHDEGKVAIEQSVMARATLGLRSGRPHDLVLFAEVCGMAGLPEEGLRALAEAQMISGARYYEAELYRVKGELLLSESADNRSEAEVCFGQALDIARRQQAKWWELRAAMSLARLWRQQGKHQAARELLAPVYGWFTEGFDTADLQEARTLLDELA
jgi:class 3 adenylate cyclase/predicted ATPase